MNREDSTLQILDSSEVLIHLNHGHFFDETIILNLMTLPVGATRFRVKDILFFRERLIGDVNNN
jgi:hypothetical protein